MQTVRNLHREQIKSHQENVAGIPSYYIMHSRRSRCAKVLPSLLPQESKTIKPPPGENRVMSQIICQGTPLEPGASQPTSYEVVRHT